MFFGFQNPMQNQQNPVQNQQNVAPQASHLIGRQVRINRGGPDSVQGILIAIPSDYLVILSDNIIVYVNGTHVKSITEGQTGGKSGGRSGGSKGRSGVKSFIRASSFQSLLSKLRHKHVQINRGGPEKLDGFLAEISSDNVLLIVDRELVRIPTFHIKNVSTSTKNNNNNNNNNNKNDNNKNDNNKNKSNKNDGNKSGKSNKAGGSQSGGGKNKKSGNGRR
jgi:spore coat protein B